MDKNIKDLGIYELNRLYREKALSPVETVSALFEEIEAGKKLNAFITTTPEQALIDARESEARFMKGAPLGPLDGIPYAVKDIFYTANVKTTMASKVYEDFTPDYNASVIDRLADGGAILMGKTNTHEFACNPMADLSHFGPCRNPYNPEHSACGSSGGSGAAVAAKMLPVTLGSDTAGSVRIPAAACGVVGMRPTQGLVSRHGVFPLSYSIDNVGPITRSVLDNAMMLNGMVGYDPRDSLSFSAPAVDYTASIENGSLNGLVFAVPEDLGTSNPVDPEIKAAFDEVLQILWSQGASIRHIPSLDPDGKYERACRTLRLADAYVVHKKGMEDHEDIYTPEIYNQMQGGKGVKAEEYISADRERLEFRLLVNELFNKVDIIITPTLPVLAPRIGTRTITVAGKDYTSTSMLTCITVLASFTGYPAITIPCGLSKSGLPIGVQLCSARLNELGAYKAAFALEKAIGFKP